MIIGIFSKFDMAGGSEFRCTELANGIAKYTEHTALLLVEKRFPSRLDQYVHEKVEIVENCFTSPEGFYKSDRILIVNSDSKEFSRTDYWRGKTHRHSFSIEMEKLKNKKMYFLYNFIVSPSRHLYEFEKYGADVSIITTNKKFFNEITKQDRYEQIRIFPRYTLESPIDPDLLEIRLREPKGPVCFGMHSKRLNNKWNDEFVNLIKLVNEKYTPEQIQFRFMGVKGNLIEKLNFFENVTCLQEDEESVKDFLNQIDVFLFFPDWKREEPWARVIAEAMVAGCPVIALNRGGTEDQVLRYNNGFLCKRLKDYQQNIIYLMEHRDIIPIMSRNSIRIAKDFYSLNVNKKLMNILEK